MTERHYHLTFTAALAAAMVFGFTRTFFLAPLFPEVQHLAAPEPFFFVHGTFVAAWFALLMVQAWLIARRRVPWHRQVGWAGAGLAVAVFALGTLGSLYAAARPTGFVGITLPPEQFLILPLSEMALFALFVALAVWRRRDLQAHKRFMLLSGIAMVEAAIVRWPLPGMSSPSPLPGVLMSEALALAFVVPMAAWDLRTRGRVHPATWLGLVLLWLVPWARGPIAATEAWQGLARAAMALVA